MLKKLFFIFVLIFCFLFTFSIKAESSDSVCAVYFTGVGCSHCAKVDPVVLENLPKEYPEFIVIEYEIYQQKENAPLLYEYNEKYNSGLGIPMIIFSEDEQAIGDRPILGSIRETIEELKGNACPLIDGSVQNFEDLNLATLPGQPKIWTSERILVKTGQENEWIFGWNGQGVERKSSTDINSNSVLQKIIKTEQISEAINGIHYTSIEPIAVPLSGKYVNFDNAVYFRAESEKEVFPGSEIEPETEPEMKLTLAKVLSLAVVDAVNPCALAVLSLMLIAILTYDPAKRKNILLAGLAFVASVFIMYLIYGLIIIKSFQLIQALTSIRLWLYKILGGTAIILGLFNIKDFLQYKGCKLGICQSKTGSFPTEMPMFLRSKVKRIISGVTSPKGAFLVGMFVTVFLLPCTIGPYIICGGILCPLGMLKSIPWLLLYNSIFILPMVVIVILVYLGTTKVEDVSGWKDKNIRYLHLIAGLIILGLGVAMFLGLV